MHRIQKKPRIVMHIPNLIQAWENERSGFFPLITWGIPSFRALLLGHTPFSMSLLSQLLILLSSLVVFRLQIGFLCSHFYFRRSQFQTLYPHLLVFFLKLSYSLSLFMSFPHSSLIWYVIIAQPFRATFLSLGVQSCFLNQVFRVSF